MNKKLLLANLIGMIIFSSSVFAKDYTCPAGDKLSIDVNWEVAGVKQGLNLTNTRFNLQNVYLHEGEWTCEYHDGNSVYTRVTRIAGKCKFVDSRDGMRCKHGEDKNCTVACD